MCSLLLFAASASASPKDRTESPYFVVKSEGTNVDSLPLKETRADVHISGVIARVDITQTYTNDGGTPLEATYVFPTSTRAAVFAMTMTVGDRTIVAKINRKDEARKIYQQAKSAGKSASLLVQSRPNVFQMSVANILPGDIIKVEMTYTELLVPEGGTYEFVYPAVVGPRFTGESKKAEGWTEGPTTPAGSKASYAWGMDVQIEGGVPIAQVDSPSHRLHETRDGNSSAIRLADGEQGGDRDFVLRYRLSGSSIQSGLLLFPGAEENFFLAMVQPPKTVARREVPRREYVFVLDVSGSMHGFPLDTAKKLMKQLSKGLRETDLFNILFFSGKSALLSETSLPATPKNITNALSRFHSLRGGGGTRLLSALNRALALPTTDEVARTFIVVTDGYISVEPAVFETIRSNLGKANMFTFGIGSSVNRHLIEGMSRVGMGESFVALNGAEATVVAKRFKTYIESPAMTNIKVQFEGFKATEVEPTSIPDLFAQRPVMVFGKYTGKPRGKIRITGTTGLGTFEQVLRPTAAHASKENNALKYLWARHRIARLDDLNQMRRDAKRVEEVTKIGLKYHLMTAYTSFVAVDERVRNKNGKTQHIRQPLPLPKGVSNRATGKSFSFSSHGISVSGTGVGAGGMGRIGSLKGRLMRKPSYSTGRHRPGQPTTESPPKKEEEEKSADRDDFGGKTEDTEASPPRHGLRLRPMVTSAKGPLSVASIVKSLRQHLRACLRGLRAGLRGIVWFEATVNARGKLIGLTRSKTSLTSAAALKCIEKSLKTMTFKQSGGKTIIRFGVRVY